MVSASLRKNLGDWKKKFDKNFYPSNSEFYNYYYSEKIACYDYDIKSNDEKKLIIVEMLQLLKLLFQTAQRKKIKGDRIAVIIDNEDFFCSEVCIFRGLTEWEYIFSKSINNDEIEETCSKIEVTLPHTKFIENVNNLQREKYSYYYFNKKENIVYKSILDVFYIDT